MYSYTIFFDWYSIDFKNIKELNALMADCVNKRQANVDVYREIRNVKADMDIMHIMGIRLTPESLINFVNFRRKMEADYEGGYR